MKILPVDTEAELALLKHIKRYYREPVKKIIGQPSAFFPARVVLLESDRRVWFEFNGKSWIRCNK